MNCISKKAPVSSERVEQRGKFSNPVIEPSRIENDCQLSQYSTLYREMFADHVTVGLQFSVHFCMRIDPRRVVWCRGGGHGLPYPTVGVFRVTGIRSDYARARDCT